MSTTRVGRRLRAQVLVDARGRCGYCRVSEELTGTPLEIEHIVPWSWRLEVRPLGRYGQGYDKTKARVLGP